MHASVLQMHATTNQLHSESDICWAEPDGGVMDMMARVRTLSVHHNHLILLPLSNCESDRSGHARSVRPPNRRWLRRHPHSPTKRSPPVHGLNERRICSAKLWNRLARGRSGRSPPPRLLKQRSFPVSPHSDVHGLNERVWTPLLMQAVFGRLGACGQVLSCVRPLYAADDTPRARMEIRGLGPNRLREL